MKHVYKTKLIKRRQNKIAGNPNGPDQQIIKLIEISIFLHFNTI
jgi:hypothetical protein